NIHLPRFYTFILTHSTSSYLYSLSLHDALPICHAAVRRRRLAGAAIVALEIPMSCRAHAQTEPWSVFACLERGLARRRLPPLAQDRKSTRLNSSHVSISYAVFCLKKKIKMKRRH